MLSSATSKKLTKDLDTRKVRSLFSDFCFSLLTPLEERRIDKGNDFDPAQELLEFRSKTHWLAGYPEALKVVKELDNPECKILFDKFEAVLTEYIKNRLHKDNNDYYCVRTDSLWDIKPSEVQDACKVVVKLLALDFKGKEISGKLVGNKLQLSTLRTT